MGHGFAAVVLLGYLTPDERERSQSSTAMDLRMRPLGGAPCTHWTSARGSAAS